MSRAKDSSLQLPPTRPFIADPGGLAKLYNRHIEPRFVLVVLPLALGLAVLIAALEGALGTLSGKLLWEDLDALFFNGSTVHSRPEFPILRDLPSLWAVVTAWLTPYLLYRQWVAFEDFLPAMGRSGLIVLDGVDQPELAKRIRHVNQSFMAAGERAAQRMLLSCFFAFLVIYSQRSSGVFGLLTSPGSTEQGFRDSAYGSWWAALDTHPAGFAFYFVSASMLIYLILTQNEVGIRYVGFFYRVRDVIRFDFDFANPDRFWGWRRLRTILWTVYWSLFFHGTSLLWLIAVTSPRALVTWMSPLLIIYVSVTITYLVVPLVLFSRGRRKAINAKADELNSSYDEKRRNGEDTAGVVAEIDRLDKVPNTVFSFRQMITPGLMFILTTGMFILQWRATATVVS